MTSCKPYLVRAIYDWIMENKCTPYLLVDAEFPGVQVPFEFVKDGQIVLNISSGATGGLMLGDEEIEFNARFGGEPRHLIVPLSAVLFIYAKENGEGMPFPPEPKPEVSEQADEPSLTSVDGQAGSNNADTSDKGRDKPAKVSHLKVIK
ncbi:ClpXP protease specificity-enhancing factor [Catenovulum adriaticum]|uniref:ClpXP protease specificity-enhancing factor n=1 Tax=Catenovulum adriaticum TaxID=2984846 RepID=A0ABY7APS0_9ALTE|nr:ClpXP protease specificity-enhancing factor [Catenovulum sp. TS8]WAJ71563.1 ClpXP protease specificity-enhancing factor [Catenovulum sp. TS8]